MADELTGASDEVRSQEHSKPTDRVVHISPLKRPETGLGKVINEAAGVMERYAMRDMRKSGVQIDQRIVDFRPGAEDTASQRQRIEEEIQRHIDRGEHVSAIGSSAGGQEALRLGKKLGVRAISNQGRLAEGATEHKPSLDHAARYHPEFGSAVRDFEENIVPQIASDPHPESYLTIGAERDSVVPSDLKSIPGISHVEIGSPRGILGLASKIPGVDHAVAIYKGLRHPAIRVMFKVNK